ncbi:DNA polymerase III subunit beta [Paenibacillus sedimenti]|uniref:Beta sliding clamp n=1 Tax=Paenibacillus sedimenti TaxID=2770274 RepID=A0A926QHU4_9BACL|nr:DNA polymerase III subunit beta [Paenibacillus sedimenti]MBD0379916.1 DNA polymerase III subunit beta [Paenibacillus sedimenti]
MLVNVTKDSLVNALQHVLKAISVNSPMPILAGINIQANANGLIFTASNTSMTIQYRIPQDNSSMTVQRTGGIVVPARYFNEIIRKLNAGLVTFEMNENLILTITSENSQIRLCGMDSADFPSIHFSDHHSSNKIQINNALLKSAIKQVAIAASTSETRPVLTGVSFEFNGASLNLVATDGIRLASRTLHIGKSANTSTNVIIPGRNLFEVHKMLSDEDDITEIEVGTNQIRFITNELQVQSALIEGVYPSIQNVIPQSYLSEVTVETSSLLHAVERVAILAGESIIRLVATTHKLDLLSRTAEIGDVQDEVPLTEMIGEDFIISLNGKFFIDILRCMDNEYVRLRFTGKASPIVILPADARLSTLFLITPVRTHN